MAALEIRRNQPDLAATVYQQLGIDAPGVRIQGHRESVSKLQPGDLVGWKGGDGEDGSYQGNMAVYAGNGEIIEKFYGNNRRRKLDPHENTFGIPVKYPQDTQAPGL
jgi:cell wall-associated NlpC family hydrolase